MSKFIVEYELSVKITSRIIIGTIIGERGRNLKNIEKTTNTKLVIEDDRIHISGTRNSVLKAENVIQDTATAHNFIAEVMNDCSGRILGVDGSNLARIQRETQAKIQVTRVDTLFSPQVRYSIEIIGNRVTFKQGLIQIMDNIEAHIQMQYATENPTKCYRNKTIEKGNNNNVIYVKGQLPPSPQTVFLDFKTELNEGERFFVPTEEDNQRTPPDYVGKNSAVLAPYLGFMYRAKVLGVFRADRKDDIYLQVKFVDFGNILTVSYFNCKTIPSVCLYPPSATACQVNNIKQEEDWNKKALKKFKHILNDSTGHITVKTPKSFNSDELVFVKISVEEVGDIGDILIENLLAEEINGPFIPTCQPIQSQYRVGYMEMLFEVEGLGGILGVTVSSYSRQSEDFTHTSHFAHTSVLDTLKTAYAVASKILNDRKCAFLNDKTLHFSVNHKRKFSGPSFGAGLTLTILSECLKKPIPQNVALTGAINGHGDIVAVGSLQQKLLAAHTNGKTVLFVPYENLDEALDMKTDIVVKPVNDIFSLMHEIWD